MAFSSLFNTFVSEIGNWVSWMADWNLFGVPFIYYALGFSIIGIIVDYIFG